MNKNDKVTVTGLQTIYADLHIHIGRTERGIPVKISGSRDLTFANIAHEASERKGIQLTGVIDCHSPAVQMDIHNSLDKGDMSELPGGGIAYRNTVILLGTEMEIREAGRPEAHVLAYFPTLVIMEDFTDWMSRHMKNVNLSSQRIYAPPKEIQQEVIGRGGLFIPAHIFTPHKGIYGSSAERMAEILDLEQIHAVELGLSADTAMAGMISELDRYAFLTNSDAHSLGKIGREYNELLLREPSFEEFRLALQGYEGRAIVANYGLNPRLGKYHRTCCTACGTMADHTGDLSSCCTTCGKKKLVRGVWDRIVSIADQEQPQNQKSFARPPYRYQVPLEFIPGLGKAKLAKLLTAFGTEMNILHAADEASLADVAGADVAEKIVKAREGRLQVVDGGGGTYGKIAAGPGK
ncbi:endonuclease Q family protein [Paenibacillus massiliensis]|uniref:endonuclease Q family protein n=1 Tax=Paenibacillus massiliensis TaxID=225917 RepID=UPI000404C67B|nr:endonuclease Q family protein [Paenibacillus massiliensis]